MIYCKLQGEGFAEFRRYNLSKSLEFFFFSEVPTDSKDYFGFAGFTVYEFSGQVLARHKI